MIAQLGTFALIIALCLAVIQFVLPLLGTASRTAHFVSITRSAALGQFVFVGLAFVCLTYLFIANDFSVAYVAANSNTKLPLVYKISAVWGAHEGSLLLWILCLGLWTIGVTAFSYRLPEDSAARILGILGIISVGFLLFTLFTSNPFMPMYYDYYQFTPEFYTQTKTLIQNSANVDLRTVLTKFEIDVNKGPLAKFYQGGKSSELAAVIADFRLSEYVKFSKFYFSPGEGRDLNPLLQDPGLAIHPPILYMGYVGLSVAFAFVMAGLLGNKIDSSWARWSRPWTTGAWVFLTLGIMLGSWWAYYELGWGGWWFWDPVENASFMPWLIATALIHSLAVTEKRGAFHTWTIILAILAFAHSLLGTFLVRSGILTSVHAFASDPARGYFLFLLLLAVIGSSLVVYAVNAHKVKSTGNFDELSRETALLFNNILLVVTSAMVLIGTLYPIVYKALTGLELSVGKPWFNLYFTIFMLPLAMLTAVGPLINWKRQRALPLLKRLAPYAVISIITGVVFAMGFSSITFPMGIMIALSTWITLCTLEVVFYRIRNLGSLSRALSGIGPGMAGMMLAHIGVAVFIIGACFASYNSDKQTVKITPGESYEHRGYVYRFMGAELVHGPNYTAYSGLFKVRKKGSEKEFEVTAAKRYYYTQNRVMTEAGLDPGFTRDLFISMGDPLDPVAQRYLTSKPGEMSKDHDAAINRLLKKTPWVVDFRYKSFVRWIWLGAILMALGGVITLFDKRYRVKVRARQAQTKVTSEAVAVAQSNH